MAEIKIEWKYWISLASLIFLINYDPLGIRGDMSHVMRLESISNPGLSRWPREFPKIHNYDAWEICGGAFKMLWQGQNIHLGLGYSLRDFSKGFNPPVSSISSMEEWNGIKPLYTTRTDVEKRLGKPNENLYDGCWAVYESTEERVDIDYLCLSCRAGAKLNGKDIALDTVLRIIVRPRKTLNISELNLDLSKFVKSKGHVPGDISYSNKEAGMGIGLAFERVRTITYFAPEDIYKQLICNNGR